MAQRVSASQQAASGSQLSVDYWNLNVRFDGVDLLMQGCYLMLLYDLLILLLATKLMSGCF